MGEAQAVPSILVPPSPFKGLNGLNFDANGQLYVGSVLEQTIYQVDTATGEYKVFINSPDGQADDLFLTPSGQIFYTALLNGEVRTFNPQTGNLTTIASGINSVNPITQNQSGRIFVGQSLNLQNTGLFEIDPTGLTDPRLILNQPGLNAFDFGSDGLLYSPLQFTGEIVKINVDTGDVEQVVSDLVTPAAVKFNSKGELFALDTVTGQVLKVNTTTGQSQPIAQLQPGLDNLAFGANDLLYATNFVDSNIQEVNTETGVSREVLSSGGLTSPGGIAIYDRALYVADTFSYRFLDRETGIVQQTLRIFATPVQIPQTVSVNDQNAIVGSWFSGVVQRLNRVSGDVLDTYTGFGAPYDAVELSDGSILVADCGNGQLTQILDKAGSNRRTVASGLLCPTGLARVDDSTVLVTEFLGNQLSRIDLTTGERQVVATNLSSPEGVAYSPNGIAVVAETGTQSVRAIDINSGKSLTILSNLPIGLPGFSGGPPPYSFTGVAIAGDTVYISGDIDNSIRTVKLDSKIFAIPETSSPLSLLALGILGIIRLARVQKRT
ncbi:PQQ-binding-like beta-propeller repeat protein [Iningainema sp. BLCCT55]|uniref:PQQ-binding-like beta-propeller repeat protein n=1 Tax=Iningainema tapete BLCC-T55 TaxID=2748662 RepID=A0A8J7CER9_9CYAN|nr:PQQ-binding-like beta-propeller repeat protein [Iningainema tapete BLCC-T55]